MDRLPSFGECVKSMLDSRDLSIQYAAQLLGMKSATSLARMLHNEVNYKTLEKFYQSLKHNQQIALTEEEAMHMEQALEIERIGQEQYLAHRVLWQLLLTNQKEDESDITVEVFCSTGTQHHYSFSKVLEQYYQCSELELYITGCCHHAILKALYPLANHAHIQCRITHFLHNVENSPHVLLSGLASIRSFLTLQNYTAYIADHRVLSPEGAALYNCNQILCSFIDAHGKKRMHHFTLVAANRLLLIEYRNPTPFRFQLARLEYYLPHLPPIKSQFPPRIKRDDYIRFADLYRKLELDRTFYCIKPDVPFSFIHPDILLSATQKGMDDTGYAPLHEISAVLQQLYDIHARRWKNIYTKKKVSHTVLSIPAMQAFVQTGMLTDHFFVLRPYTPSERRKILAHIRRHMQENPYFNVYFAKGDAIPFQLEITSFGNAGVLLAATHTSYNFSEGHSEALITQQDFSDTFQDFFLHELLPRYVLSPRDSMAIMDQWIASLPETDE